MGGFIEILFPLPEVDEPTTRAVYDDGLSNRGWAIGPPDGPFSTDPWWRPHQTGTNVYYQYPITPPPPPPSGGGIVGTGSAPGGGSSEAGNANDGSTTTLDAVDTFNELSAASDTITSALDKLLGASDAASATVTATTTASFVLSITEGGTARDGNFINNLPSSQTESASATETESVILHRAVSVTEALRLLDSETTTLHIAETMVEGGVAAERDNLIFNVNETEAANASAAEASYVNAVSSSITEAATAATTQSETLGAAARITEAGSASMTTSDTASYVVSIHESGIAVDIKTGGVSSTQSITEAASASELSHADGYVVHESASASDSETGLAHRVASITEAGNASATANAVPHWARSIREATNATDTIIGGALLIQDNFPNTSGTVNGLTPPAGYSSTDLLGEDHFSTANLDLTKWVPWLGWHGSVRTGSPQAGGGNLPSPYSGNRMQVVTISGGFHVNLTSGSTAATLTWTGGVANGLVNGTIYFINDGNVAIEPTCLFTYTGTTNSTTGSQAITLAYTAISTQTARAVVISTSPDGAQTILMSYLDPYPYCQANSPVGWTLDTWSGLSNTSPGDLDSGLHLRGGSNVLQISCCATTSSTFFNLGWSTVSSTISTKTGGPMILPATGGFVQVRAKIADSRYGSWNAIWMMPDTLDGDALEIDLLEAGYTQGFQPNQCIASNFHSSSVTLSGLFPHQVAASAGLTQVLSETPGVDLTADYHLYGVELIPGVSIKIYFDNVLLGTWTQSIPTTTRYTVFLTGGFSGPLNSGWRTVYDPAHPGPFEAYFSDVQVYALPTSKWVLDTTKWNFGLGNVNGTLRGGSAALPSPYSGPTRQVALSTTATFTTGSTNNCSLASTTGLATYLGGSGGYLINDNGAGHLVPGSSFFYSGSGTVTIVPAPISTGSAIPVTISVGNTTASPTLPVGLCYEDPYPALTGSVATSGQHTVEVDGTLQLIVNPLTAGATLASGSYNPFTHGFDYVSGAIYSNGKTMVVPVTGGYVETRLKCPDMRYGAYPRIQFQPNTATDGSNYFGFEFGHGTGVTSSGIIDYQQNFSFQFNGINLLDTRLGVDLSAAYHIFGVDYRPNNYVKVYFDGTLLFSCFATTGSTLFPNYYSQPIPTGGLALQLSHDLVSYVGGNNWHSIVTVGHTGPFVFNIDYVKIYDSKP
jgi:hypothetical protein